MCKVVFTLTFLLVFVCSVAAADVLHLKNGAKLEGQIVKETENGITFRTAEGSVFWRHSEIEAIDQGFLTSERRILRKGISRVDKETEEKDLKKVFLNFIK